MHLLRRFFWLLPLGFYAATVSRTPGWVDAPLIARTVHRLEISTWVNHHNLFTLVGHGWLRLTPYLEPHFALNLLCSVLGAATVYGVFRVGIRLTNNDFASALGAIALMVSHSLWWHSTMLEVYTLSTLLLVLTVLFVLRFEQDRRFSDFGIATFFFGLACSNHVQMGLVGFGFLGFLAAREPRRELLKARRVLALLACFFLGFQIYLWVFFLQLLELTGSGVGTSGALEWMIDNTTGGGFKRFMFAPGVSLRERFFWWAYYAGLFVYNFPPPWILFAPVGALAWLRRGELRGSWTFVLLALAVQVVWSANYFVWDMYAFALPAYTLTAVPLIVGLDWTMRQGLKWKRLIYALAPTVLLIPFLYSNAPAWLTRSKRATQFFERIPQYEQVTAFWDPWAYFLNPNKQGYDLVERYSREILRRLEPNACFWGNEATIFYPLKFYYHDVLGERDDVSYHLVFGMLGGEQEFAAHASTMVRQLEQGCPVYVSSLAYPERDVLNVVYSLLRGSRSPEEAARLTRKELVEGFPGYQLEPSQVDGIGSPQVYRLAPR